MVGHPGVEAVGFLLYSIEACPWNLLNLSVAKNPSICKIRKFRDLRTCAWMVLKVVDGGCYEQVTFVSWLCCNFRGPRLTR
jgi:hypothetical protein